MPLSTHAQDRIAHGQHPNTAAHSPSALGDRPSSSGTSAGFGPRGNAFLSVNTKSVGTASGPASGAGSDRAGAATGDARRTGEEARGTHNNEMWEEKQRRHRAATVLGSWEMLAWYAVAGDEVCRYFYLFFRSLVHALVNECGFAIQRDIKSDLIISGHEGSHSQKSIPQTRLRFQRMMFGIPDSASSDEWEDEKYGGEKKSGGNEDIGTNRSGNLGSGGMKRKH